MKLQVLAMCVRFFGCRVIGNAKQFVSEYNLPGHSELIFDLVFIVHRLYTLWDYNRTILIFLLAVFSASYAVTLAMMGKAAHEFIRGLIFL